VILVFIFDLDKVGGGRFKSSVTFVTLPPFADVEVSEVLPSCEYVDADDTDALGDGTVVRAFFGFEGVAVCVDMSLRFSVVQRRSSLATGAKAPRRRIYA